jgi:alpha-mannosidase
MTDPTPSATTPYYTMFLDQSAHLDWDWIRTFAQNYWYYTDDKGVNDIIASGIKKAQDCGGAGGAYYYTVCEMGFFRRFIDVNPNQVTAIKKLGDNFQVISGGVTSPDCLVCSGEGFVRNYLVGQTWLSATLDMTPKPQCWLPDDFGQGPTLPALLTALGFVGMAFSRLPGTSNYPNLTLWKQLVANGLDFTWTASDGSSVVAHWLINSYAFGNEWYPVSSSHPHPKPDPGAINNFIAYYYSSPASLPPPAPPPPPLPPPLPTYSGAVTPYMYIPIDNDFSMPIEPLASDIAGWNDNSVSVGAAAGNVTVVQGTFDQFVTAVQSRGGLAKFAYNGTPYWTGYYASRPELKILHYETVRALTAAEVIALLTKPGDASLKSMLPTDFWQRIDQAWTDFAPSTHHDYVCGTAPDPVYANDQLPLLRGVAATAHSLRGIALDALAGMACGRHSYGYGVIVANPLGFARSGVAAIDAIAPFGGAVTWDDKTNTTTPTQTSAEGGMLVYASVPSFGYLTGGANGGGGTAPDTASLTPKTSGAASYVIANEYLSATISAKADWGIESLFDVKNNNAAVLSGTGNAIVFYDDNGGLYQFGNEAQYSSMPVIRNMKVATDGAWLGAMVMESGPLRSWLRTAVLITVTFKVNGRETTTTTRFVRDYILCAGEPFLRMTTTGAAPAYTSVMAAFPLKNAVTAITHGTPYHWTDVQPLSGFWGPPMFRPTQDFVLPQGATMAAVYHGGMPAWAFDADGALIGCLLRNTPADDGHGASGSDPAPHTQHYALRVPTGLDAPSTGQPLQEALGFHTPLVAAALPQGTQYKGMLTATQASLAALPAGSPAVLTVAKPGSYDPTSLVLRLYQPTNTAQTFAVTLPSTPSAATLVTATETAWSGSGSAAPANDGITVTMAGAVATVAIPGLGLSG